MGEFRHQHQQRAANWRASTFVFLIAFSPMLSACISSSEPASRATSYAPFKAHTASERASTAFGPEWSREQAVDYSVRQLAWLRSFQPESCYGQVWQDLTDWFTQTAQGSTSSGPPIGIEQHLLTAERDCR
jgi:hypothetical protein